MAQRSQKYGTEKPKIIHFCRIVLLFLSNILLHAGGAFFTTQPGEYDEDTSQSDQFPHCKQFCSMRLFVLPFREIILSSNFLNFEAYFINC